jgi:protein-disulfide isomerase
MQTSSVAAMVATKRRMVRITGLFLLVAMMLPASSPSVRADSGDPDSAVLASVGSYQITRKQVDDAVLRNVSPSQLYDLRKRVLDQIVDDHLIDQAAKKAGLAREQYVERETKRPAPTEVDARKFFDDHKAAIQAQMKDATFDHLKPQILATLTRQSQQEARTAMLDKLRKETPVNVTLAPPRFAVNSADHPWSGGAGAPVTVVEFSDFQCPYCRAAQATVKAMREKYGDRVKFVYMDFPLGFHEHAMDAARAAQCASDQNKFWPYHDALFADQSKLASADLKATAAKLGLDPKKFATCYDTAAPDARVKADQAQGSALGVTGTPTFFINGREIVGSQPLDKLSEIIDDETTAANLRASKAN